MFNVLRVKNSDSVMCGECRMFDVSVALESCMICGVWSCGSVRSTRGIVAFIITPPRDNCFILHLHQSLSNATFADGIFTAFFNGKRFVHDVVVRHGKSDLGLR